MAAMIRSARRRSGRGRTPMAEINVTPLVDVMLVLLIVFMVTAPLLNAAVPLDLPDSSAKPMEQAQEQVTVSLDGTGALYLDQRPVTLADFPAALAAIPRGADGAPIPAVLRADKRLDYGRVIAVMGELNRAGFSRISLVTNAGNAGTDAVTEGSADVAQE